MLYAVMATDRWWSFEVDLVFNEDGSRISFDLVELFLPFFQRTLHLLRVQFVRLRSLVGDVQRQFTQLPTRCRRRSETLHLCT